MPFTVLDPGLAAAAPATTVGSPLTNVGVTLAQLREEVGALVGDRDDVTPGRIDLWINEAYTDLYTSLKIDEGKGSVAITTVAGQPFYGLPTVVSSIISVSVLLPEAESFTKGRPLEKIDLSTYRALQAEDDDPLMFFRYGQMLVLWPTPDAVRTLGVDFRVRPLWLTADSDSPNLDLEWHEAVKIGARRRAHSAVKEFDLAAAAEQEYVALVRRRTDREAEEDTGRIVGSSRPRRASDLRNRVYMRHPEGY